MESFDLQICDSLLFNEFFQNWNFFCQILDLEETANTLIVRTNAYACNCDVSCFRYFLRLSFFTVVCWWFLFSSLRLISGFALKIFRQTVKVSFKANPETETQDKNHQFFEKVCQQREANKSVRKIQSACNLTAFQQALLAYQLNFSVERTR